MELIPPSSNGFDHEDEMSGLPGTFKKIPVVEIFGPTIQGEGLSIGQLTYFIRFGLCDYRCTFCDSMHAVDPIQVKVNATWMSQRDAYNALEELAAKNPHSTKWITFTGGNPLVHDLDHLMNLLYKGGWKVNVETQGSLYKEWVRKADIITISPKAPAMTDQFDLAQLATFVYSLDTDINKAYFKFVVFDKTDLDFVAAVANSLQIRPERIVMSQGNRYPDQNLLMADMWGNLHKDYLDMFELIKSYPGLAQCKYLPQWHVWIWGNRQGV